MTLDNPDAFFPLLDAVIDSENILSNALAPDAIYNAVLQTAVSNGFLSEPDTLAIAELHLALHSATPKIEGFYQYYRDVHDAKEPSPKGGDNCGSWVDWYGEVVCDVENLIRLAGRETLDSSETGHTPTRYVPSNGCRRVHIDNVPSSPPARPKILPFDHIYPSPSQNLQRPPHTAVFYASLTSTNFRELHTCLSSFAKRPVPHVEYVFRHIPPPSHNESERNYLSGYGVALDLKKMEYLAVDDRYTSQQS